MSFTTTSADNIITIGDTNDTIKLNQIMPMYTSIPGNNKFNENSLISLNSLGGFFNGTSSNINTNIGQNVQKTFCTFSSIPAGNYLIYLHARVYSSSPDPGYQIKISNTQDDTANNQWNGTMWLGEDRFMLSFPYINSSTQNIYINISTAADNGLNVTDVYYAYIQKIG